MKIKFPFLVAVLSFFWAGLVHAQADVFFTPENPTTEDVISVTAQFPIGPFVETQSHSIDGNEIHVLFVQDGLDFSPNPPHQATEIIGHLPAGQYTIYVVLSAGGFEKTEMLSLNVAGSSGPPASSEVIFTPDNPTTEDVVSVIAQFRTGPFVETQSHSIDEDEIHVLFVQDGLDFSPNPPHEAIEIIGRPPAGRYTIFATVLFPGVHETTTTLDLVVTGLQTPQEIPVINTLGAIILIILLLLIGLFAIRARTHAGFVSLILVFSFLPEADLLAEETNSLYVLLALGENAPTPSEVVEGWNSSQSPLTLSAGATDPVAVRYLLPLRAERDFALRLNANPDSPRAKLKRMVVVEYPTTADRESAMNMLLADSQVETVSRTRKYELSSPNLANAGSANYGWSAFSIVTYNHISSGR